MGKWLDDWLRASPGDEAGWYSDPASDRRDRYWDGKSWTDRVRWTDGQFPETNIPLNTDAVEQQQKDLLIFAAIALGVAVLLAGGAFWFGWRGASGVFAVLVGVAAFFVVEETAQRIVAVLVTLMVVGWLMGGGGHYPPEITTDSEKSCFDSLVGVTDGRDVDGAIEVCDGR